MLSRNPRGVVTPVVRQSNRIVSSSKRRAFSSVHLTLGSQVTKRQRSFNGANTRSLSSWRFGRRSCGASSRHWAEPLHRPDCTWLNSETDPYTTPLDGHCAACQGIDKSELQLSRKELEWERERQKGRILALEDQRQYHRDTYQQMRKSFHEMFQKDPYEMMFGASNRRLRGIFAEKDVLSWRKSLSDWQEKTHALMMDHLQRGYGDNTKGPEPTKQTPDKATAESDKPVINASLSWSTSGVKDGKAFSSSGELVYDPISMRMVPKVASAEPIPIPSRQYPVSVPLQTAATTPEPKSSLEKTARTPSSLEKTKQALESSWVQDKTSRIKPLEPAIDRMPKQNLSENNKSQRSVYLDAAASTTATETELMKSTIRNMVKIFPSNSIVKQDPRTSSHERFEDAKAQALRELSQAENWTFASLSELGAARLDLLHKRVEAKALEIMVKQDPVAFNKLPKHDHVEHAQTDLKFQQRAWEAKATAHDKAPGKNTTSWPSSETWHNFKNAFRQATPPKAIEYSSQEARHACLSVFRKDKPLRHMNNYELGIHRANLLQSWSQRHTPKEQAPSEKLLDDEVGKYKSAMNAFESKWSKYIKPASRDVSEIAGEGDIDAKVLDHCTTDKWYKQTAPHAWLSEQSAKLDHQKQSDKDLVKDIKHVYESAYGVIDVNHMQENKLEDSLEDYEKKIGDKAYSFTTDALKRTSSESPEQVSTQTTPGLTSESSPEALTIATPKETCVVSSKTPNSTASSPQKPTMLLNAEQQVKNVNSLLNMYRKQSDGYVEVIGRLQRKMQKLQRQIDEASAASVKGTAPAARESTNPVDGTMSRKPFVAPPTGNFASPTGFVGEVPSFNRPNNANGSRPVRREEAVFSGQQPLQKASIQEIIDHLQTRLGATQSDESQVRSTQSSPPPQYRDGNSRSSSGRRFKHRTQASETSQLRKPRSDHWMLRTFTAMIGVGFFGAAAAYAIGVVIEYFREGPKSSTTMVSQNEERGWTAAGNRSRRYNDRATASATMTNTVNSNTDDKQALQSAWNDHMAEMRERQEAAWRKNAATVLVMPFVGLGFMYAFLAMMRRR